VKNRGEIGNWSWKNGCLFLEKEPAEQDGDREFSTSSARVQHKRPSWRGSSNRRAVSGSTRTRLIGVQCATGLRASQSDREALQQVKCVAKVAERWGSCAAMLQPHVAHSVVCQRGDDDARWSSIEQWNEKRMQLWMEATIEHVHVCRFRQQREVGLCQTAHESDAIESLIQSVLESREESRRGLTSANRGQSQPLTLQLLQHMLCDICTIHSSFDTNARCQCASQLKNWKPNLR
jgi:hypothetical protein